ncbi:hypothetical protein AU252_22850 [Pseudarthrobacter sulfonivorans]|uniref:Uncharacterized protein n=1 Tax=Pseudarthrobacter sulfonivorans TaxID=121292 RepID=A0A0U3FJ16_9MICC|nr:hypothetical protein AU252_00015 [Pseudarthrobacter sulfonivorans]ALV43657.1 hypothetical protein AU252_22850 [Pseudarthrobacter sulfonivorans]
MPTGKKLIDYPLTVTCPKGVTIRIIQDLWEDDPFYNDHNGRFTHDRSFLIAGGTVTVHNVQKLVDTESGEEAVFHSMSFKVTSGTITSGTSGGQNSANLYIYD